MTPATLPDLGPVEYRPVEMVLGVGPTRSGVKLHIWTAEPDPRPSWVGCHTIVPPCANATQFGAPRIATQELRLGVDRWGEDDGMTRPDGSPVRWDALCVSCRNHLRKWMRVVAVRAEARGYEQVRGA